VRTPRASNTIRGLYFKDVTGLKDFDFSGTDTLVGALFVCPKAGSPADSISSRADTEVACGSFFQRSHSDPAVRERNLLFPRFLGIMPCHSVGVPPPLSNR